MRAWARAARSPLRRARSTAFWDSGETSAGSAPLNRFDGEGGGELAANGRPLIRLEHALQGRYALAVHLACCTVETPVVGQSGLRRKLRLTCLQTAIDRVEKCRPVGRIAAEQLGAAELDHQRIPTRVIRRHDAEGLLELACCLLVHELTNGLPGGQRAPLHDLVRIRTCGHTFDEVGRGSRGVRVGDQFELFCDRPVQHGQLEAVGGGHERHPYQVVDELEITTAEILEQAALSRSPYRRPDGRRRETDHIGEQAGRESLPDHGCGGQCSDVVALEAVQAFGDGHGELRRKCSAPTAEPVGVDPAGMMQEAGDEERIPTGSLGK